jgi:hypothetical protein
MGHHGRKRFARKMRHAGKKTVRGVKHAAQKVDLEKTGHLMEDVGQAGEMLSGVLALTGNEELAVPLLGASEALKYSGRAVGGVGRAKKQLDDKNYTGAASTLQKTVVTAKQNKTNYDKKYR